MACAGRGWSFEQLAEAGSSSRGETYLQLFGLSQATNPTQFDVENRVWPRPNDQIDFAIPGEPYTFSILKQVQALGDFHALAKRERRVIGIDLGHDTLQGLNRLLDYV